MRWLQRGAPRSSYAMSGARAGRVFRFAVALGLAIVAAGTPRLHATATRAEDSAAARAPDEVAWSLLAVGDTGAKPWRIARARQVNARVARALTAEDLRAPADVLVLLGDNFYPDGLRREELEARVRGNLAEPFCRFLPAPDVACPMPSRAARVLAVLGNHDHESPESPSLQRHAIPRMLPSWSVPERPVQSIEVGGGVSLVLYDAHELAAAGSFAPLVEAVRASPGPWRIVVGHHPLTLRESDVLGRAARAALAGVDAPLHLHLAGHRHYLELARADRPPFLQAIAGSGSNVRPLKEPLEGSFFQLAQPGFARVDLVRGADGDRLVVSLFALSGHRRLGGARAEVVARGSVGLEGGAREEPVGGAETPPAEYPPGDRLDSMGMSAGRRATDQSVK